MDIKNITREIMNEIGSCFSMCRNCNQDYCSSLCSGTDYHAKEQAEKDIEKILKKELLPSKEKKEYARNRNERLRRLEMTVQIIKMCDYLTTPTHQVSVSVATLEKFDIEQIEDVFNKLTNEIKFKKSIDKK